MMAAQERGEQMFRYDQAAWHATDRFLADLQSSGRKPMDKDLALGGYIVEPLSARQLQVTFVTQPAVGLRAIARYRVDAAGEVDGAMLAPGADAGVSAMAARMLTARDSAMVAFRKP